MLCVVCSRPIPIPIYRDENKLCKTCASEIKIKRDLIKDLCTDDDLEIVQRQLLQELNLEDDSDYETELNYLKEAKKNSVLSKDKPLQSIHPTEGFKECSQNQFVKLRAEIDTHGKQNAPEISNGIRPLHKWDHLQKSFFEFKFFSTLPTPQTDQKLEQSCGCEHATKRKNNRRLQISRDLNHSIVSVTKCDEPSNQSIDEIDSIACRALLRPTRNAREPAPQYEKIQPLEGRGIIKPETTSTAGNRNPFICPVTFCKNIIPVSDLIKHFKLNHIRVPIVPVDADVCTNLFWEAKMDQFAISQCLMLLLSNRTHNYSDTEHFRDGLPIAVMTTKVKFSDLTEMECDPDDDRHFYLVWLTAMTSSTQTVHCTITAWSGMEDGQVHIVNTMQAYSIRLDQNPKMLYQSGQVMMLTADQINRLSNNSQDMVKLQIVVH